MLCLPLAVTAAFTGVQAISWSLVGAAVVSALLHLAYSLTLQAGYDRADLGIVYPTARGIGPLLTMIVAVLVLAERPSLLAIAGAAAVLTGILVVTASHFRTESTHTFRGVTWGTATGTTIATYTLWDAYAIGQLHLSPISYYAGTLLAQSLLLAPSIARRRKGLAHTLRVDLAPLLAVAILSPLAYVLVLTAMQTAPVSLIAPLRESSIVISSLLAWRLFHEDHLVRRLTGAVIVLAGIVAMSL
jgi:drug/metabolite transporter (DMT)-like permease